MLEMPEADRLTVKELISFFDQEGSLSPIIDALGQKTKQESTTSTSVVTGSGNKDKLLEEIRTGRKLRKAVQNRPEVTIDAPSGIS